MCWCWSWIYSDDDSFTEAVRNHRQLPTKRREIWRKAVCRKWGSWAELLLFGRDSDRFRKMCYRVVGFKSHKSRLRKRNESCKNQRFLPERRWSIRLVVSRCWSVPRWANGSGNKADCEILFCPQVNEKLQVVLCGWMNTPVASLALDCASSCWCKPEVLGSKQAIFILASPRALLKQFT